MATVVRKARDCILDIMDGMGSLQVSPHRGSSSGFGSYLSAKMMLGSLNFSADGSVAFEHVAEVEGPAGLPTALGEHLVYSSFLEPLGAVTFTDTEGNIAPKAIGQ